MKQSYHFLFVLFLICFTTKLYSQSVPTYVPTNGLVGWWGLNGDAQDRSGNGNHGTVNGATLTTDRFGNQNGAYSFDGLNDDIQIASLANFDFQKKVSISVWINVNNYPGIKYNIVTKYGNNTDAFALDIAQNNLIFDLSTGWPNWFFYSSPFQWSVNNWYHIVSNYDFNGNKRNIYVNGQFHDSSNIIPAMINALSSNVVFGYFHNGQSIYNYQRYNGKLDDIGIWNRALTQHEITNLYNSQLPTQTSLCLPTITTSTPTSIGIDSVVIGGNILNDGGSFIVLRGVCYSTTPNPNMGNPRTEEGSGIGSFTSILRNLSPSTTYYARSYAKNSQGVVVYGNEVSFSTGTPTPGMRCPGTPTVTDIDGNVYNTVQIGTQCWTQSNLKVSKYRNGDSIPTGLSNSSWGSTTSGAYAIYDNNPVNDSLYGKLYNHYAVMDTRGLCPTGWHVPTDGEWDTLESYLGGPVQSAKALMTTDTLASSTVSWNFLNWNNIWNFATNSSGFSALPGGHRDDNGDFTGLNYQGFFWSSSKEPKWNDPNSFWRKYRLLQYSSLDGSVYLHHGDGNPTTGFSVRCLINTLPQVNTTSNTNVTPSTALVTGEVNSDGGDQNTTRGFCYSTTSNPTISNDTTMNGTGAGVYSVTLHNLTPLTTYYVRAYATNSVGTSYGNELNFLTLLPSAQPCPGTPTVTDIDGNAYNTVQIGNQCWTQSNLKVSKYRNGDNIPTGLSNWNWASTTTGAYSIYNNNNQLDNIFGKLYNFYSVIDTRGLCPVNWHVPTEVEWTILEDFLGGNISAGGKLKSTLIQPSTGGWNFPNTGASNSSGFHALPAGDRTSNGDYTYLNVYGNFWTTTSYGGQNSPYAIWRSLNHDSDFFFYHYSYKRSGYSVRCLRD